MLLFLFVSGIHLSAITPKVYIDQNKNCWKMGAIQLISVSCPSNGAVLYPINAVIN